MIACTPQRIAFQVRHDSMFRYGSKVIMKAKYYGALISILLLSTVGLSQQTVPFRNNIPVAATGRETRPLPKLPMEFDTGEGQRIRVVQVAHGLAFPWSMAFLPDGA